MATAIIGQGAAATQPDGGEKLSFDRHGVAVRVPIGVTGAGAARVNEHIAKQASNGRRQQIDVLVTWCCVASADVAGISWPPGSWGAPTGC